MAKSNEQEPRPIPIPLTPGWQLTRAIHTFLDPSFVHRPNPEDVRGPWGALAEAPLLKHFPDVIERHLPQWGPNKYFFDEAEEIAAKQHPILDVPDPKEAYIPEQYGNLSIQMAQVAFGRTIVYDSVDDWGDIHCLSNTGMVAYVTYYYPDAPGDALFSVGKFTITSEGRHGPLIESHEYLVPDTSTEALQVAQYLEDHMHAYFGRNSATV